MSDEQKIDRRKIVTPEKREHLARISALGVTAAVGQHTGPVTEEGKARASRNNWRHGMYSKVSRAPQWQTLGMVMKPCRTTCALYPCALVQQDKTREGGDCLDKTVYVEAFDNIITALHSGDAQSTHGLLAAQMAGALEMLQGLRNEIAGKGFIVERPLVNKSGNVVGYDQQPNPVLAHYIKMLDTLGINLPELMLTPQANTKHEREEEEADALAVMMGRLMAGAAGASARSGPVRRRTIDVTPDDDEGDE